LNRRPGYPFFLRENGGYGAGLNASVAVSGKVTAPAKSGSNPQHVTE
jgi:hypothetical protein